MDLERIISEEEISQLIKKSSLKVAIIGMGSIGREIAKDISKLSEVQKIYIVSRDLEKAKESINEIGLKESKFEAEDSNSLGDILKETDISIISAGVHNPSRYDKNTIAKNKELISGYAENHTGFNGTVIVVTNPTDLLAYHFAAASHMNPLNVVGMNLLDARRFRKIIYDTFIRVYSQTPEALDINEIDAMVIGPHDEKYFVPLFSQVTVRGIPIKRFTMYSEEFKEYIQFDLDSFATDIAKTFREDPSPTRQSTAEAVTDVIQAISNENDTVCVSTYSNGSFDGREYGKGEIFIGQPVRFRSFSAITQPLELNDDEAEKFKLAYSTLRDYLRKFRLESRIAEPIKPRERTEEVAGLLRRTRDRIKEELERAAREGEKGALNKVGEVVRRELEEFLDKIPKVTHESIFDLEGYYTNLILQASQKGQIWHGYKYREFNGRNDEWGKSRDFPILGPKREPISFKDVNPSFYKVVVLQDKEDNPEFFLWQLYEKTNPTHFRAIFHTNSETYAKSECDGRSCSGNCTGYRGHVDKWQEGIAPEILEINEVK